MSVAFTHTHVFSFSLSLSFSSPLIAHSSYTDMHTSIYHHILTKHHTHTHTHTHRERERYTSMHTLCLSVFLSVVVHGGLWCACVVHPIPLKVFFIITAMIPFALWLDSAPRMRNEKNTMRGKSNTCIEGNKMSTPERMKRRKSLSVCLWIEHRERERERERERKRA